MKTYELKQYQIDSDRIPNAIEEVNESISAKISNTSKTHTCEVLSINPMNIEGTQFLLVTFVITRL